MPAASLLFLHQTEVAARTGAELDNNIFVSYAPVGKCHYLVQRSGQDCVKSFASTDCIIGFIQAENAQPRAGGMLVIQIWLIGDWPKQKF